MGKPIDEVRAQMTQRALDEFPELEAHRATLAKVIAVVTDGWRCEKNVQRDKRVTVPENQDKVHYRFTTPSRVLTGEEVTEREAEREARRRRTLWRPEDGPPPVDIGTLRLLDQSIWWVSKDERVSRLIDMHPNHRENLYKMLMRNALTLNMAEFSRYMVNAPDDVADEFDRMKPEEWLKGTPLMKRLRKLIKWDKKIAKLAAEGVNVSEEITRADLV